MHYTPTMVQKIKKEAVAQFLPRSDVGASAPESG